MKTTFLRKSLCAMIATSLFGGVTAIAKKDLYTTGFALDHNNEKYVVEKYVENGQEIKKYTAADGRVADSLDKLAKPFKTFVSPDAIKQAQYKTLQNGELHLTVLLKAPKTDLTKIRYSYKKSREAIRSQVLPIKKVLNKSTLQKYKDNIEINKTAFHQIVAETKKQDFAPVEVSFRSFVESLGGKVSSADFGSSSAEIIIPANQLTTLQNFKNLLRVEVSRPNQLMLDTIVQSLNLRTPSGADAGFWAMGSIGNPYDVGILDGVRILPTNGFCNSPGIVFGGIQEDHPNLDHVEYVRSPITQNNDPEGHPTNVAGVMYSNNDPHTGAAYGVDKVFVGDCICNENAELTWMVTASNHSLEDTAEVINMSCGSSNFDANNNRLSSTIDLDASGIARDVIVDDFDIVFVQSAGNDGNISAVSSLLQDSSGYNFITVGAVKDQNTVGVSDDKIANLSARGPTQVLNRKKPDIVASGHKVKTTSADWATDDNFEDVTGTSFSAPVVSSIATLLADHLEGPDSKVIKALLINHAQAWSDNDTPADLNDDFILPFGFSEWNSSWGWGYLDAVNTMGGSQIQLVSTVAGPNHNSIPATRYYRSNSSLNSKATLVWNQHQNMPLTDLDLYVYDANNGNRTAFSTSIVDNVEQVNITPQDFVLKVEAQQNVIPMGLDSEEFALAGVTAEDEVQPPQFDFEFNATAIAPGNQFTWSFQSVNTGELPAFDVNLSLELPEGYEVLSQNPVNVGKLGVNQGSGLIEFTIQAPCQPSEGEVKMVATSSSYGENFRNEHVRTVSNIPSYNSLRPSSRYSGNLPETLKLPNENSAWIIATLRPRTDTQQPLEMSLILDQCNFSAAASSSINKTTDSDWVAVNKQLLPDGTDAIINIAATDGNAYSDVGRVQMYSPSLPIKTGESASYYVPTYGINQIYQVDGLYRGMEVTATASIDSGQTMKMFRLDGFQFAGSSQFYEERANNQMTIQGTGQSPALVIAPLDETKDGTSNIQLSVSEVKDCKANFSISNLIFNSGFETNTPFVKKFNRESPLIFFDNYPVEKNSVTVYHNYSMNSEAVTIEAWVRPSIDLLNSELNYIASKRSEDTGFALYALLEDNKKTFRFDGNTANGNEGVQSTTEIQQDNWYHVAGVYADGKIKLYVNGELEAEKSVSGPLQFNEIDFHIGSSQFFGNTDWLGYIDEVRMWDREVSYDDLANNAQACLTGDESGLIGYWRFDSVSSYSAMDASINYNQGEIINVDRVTP